jgi:hypothetical protein
LLLAVKSRLADPKLNRQARRVLESVLDKTRAAWVNADPAKVSLPAVSTEQMSRWLDDLLRRGPITGNDRLARDAAERELTDLLVRDDARETLLGLVKEKMAATSDASALATLEELVDFARPAMAAEVWGHQVANIEIGQEADWDHRQHLIVQHLIVGVPQMAEGAARATHFDRCDDQTAHCVSGNSLTPGDYPVGVAIPNPNVNNQVMYYLVNLPTPRRRVAYAYHLKRDETARLKEVSRRTLDNFLANRRALDELHIMMLQQLDPREVSRFAGPYFELVPDRKLPTTGADPAGQLTMHTMICSVLCAVGTHEAVPALEKLARSGQLGKPSFENPFDIAWIAALASAARDPWPEIDAWLAGLIDETGPIVTNSDPVAEVGASAAAMLLERHNVSTSLFDLEPSGETGIERSRFAGFHFRSEDGRKRVAEWWARQKQAKGQDTAP